MSVYFFKPAARFKETIFWSFLGIITITINQLFDHVDLTNLILDGLWLILIIVYMHRLINYLYFALTKKSMLTVNDDYIFDHFNGRKYYWEDIDFVDAYDNYLSLKFYDKEKYIKSPNRLIRFFLKKRIGTINTSDLKIEKGKYAAFLETLNNYSLTSTENVKEE